MNKIYLNDHLKTYYTSCLREELLLGNIDQGIKDILLSLCEGKNVRPLFSKKGKHDIKNYLHSYLQFSFTSVVEHQLLTNIKPTLETNFSLNRQYDCNGSELPPRIQSKREITEINKGSKWLVDPNYFNVSQIKFDLSKGDSKLHDKFWVELGDCLIKLG